MRTQTYGSEPANYIPAVRGHGLRSDPVVEEEQDFFTPAAAPPTSPLKALQRIDWTAVGAGVFVYAVAFATWVWLVR